MRLLSSICSQNGFRTISCSNQFYRFHCVYNIIFKMVAIQCASVHVIEILSKHGNGMIFMNDCVKDWLSLFKDEECMFHACVKDWLSLFKDEECMFHDCVKDWLSLFKDEECMFHDCVKDCLSLFIRIYRTFAIK
jgi:hypothetical protein